jgi:hypothetical protein
MPTDPRRNTSTDPKERSRSARIDEAIHALVSRQELFARRVAEPRLDSEGLGRSEAIWFGVGLSSGDVSRGVPVDVLVLVYAQELLRRELGYGESRILVADTNALGDGIAQLPVHRARTRAERTLRSVIATLGFPAVVLRASEVDGEAEAIVRDVDAPNPYVARQIGQTEVMRRRGAAVKLGWALSGVSHDEVYFDRLYHRAFGAGVSFVYTTGGRTLNPRRPRACPYLCVAPDDRLLLRPNEDLAAKLARAPKPMARGYHRLLAKLARAHHRLTGERYQSPEELIQRLVDALPEGEP